MKNTLYPLIIAASLPLIAQTVPAQTVLFSDNYTVGANAGDPNTDLTNPGRQGGSLAILNYIESGNVQVGNTGTLPIDPGDASSGDSFLAAFGGSAYINYDFSIVTGPLEIDFKGLQSSIANGGLTDWVSFNVGNGAGAPFVNNSAVSSILFRANGGIELWNQGSVNDPPSGGFAPGFNAWTSYKVILSDTAGTGSAFAGNGSRADYYSNGSFIGTFNMNQLGAGQGFIGFSGGTIQGYDNVTISGTLPAVIAPTLVTDIEPLQSEVTTGQSLTLSVAVTGKPLNYQWYNQSGAIGGATTNSYSFNAVAGTNYYQVIITNSGGSVTSSIASVISATNIVTVNNYSFENGGTSHYGNGELPTGWSPFNDGGNWAGLGTSGGGFNAPDGNTYLAINTIPASSGPSGVYQDVGALLPNTTYTLTVAVGRSTAAGVPPNGVGDWSPGIISLLNGTNSTGALLATTTGYPSVVGTWQDYTATFSTGPAPSGHLVVTLSDAPANTYQATFDNVRLTSVVSSVPLPILLTNTTPTGATVALGSNVVFTASFSNSPAVTLQWQQIVSGSPNVTNNVNTGVVTVTSNGVVTSTLTLNDVQLSQAGSYRLEALSGASAAVYTAPAALMVVPTITWYAAGTYNSTFSDDTVLGLAGSTANEVYGVDFGVGAMTTVNGYSFDDYIGAGNMSIAGTVGSFGGYLGSGTTGDSYLDIILNNGVYGSAANTGTLNNLTVGQTYTVLVLLDDTRSSPGGQTFQVTDGITFSPAQRYAFVGGTPAVGGFIMGTFTAQATTQPLTVLNNGNSQYNAILLEKGIATPPPIPPSLTTDVPQLLEVTTGASVTLSVGASGALPLLYQWSNQSGPISGATNSSYSFNAVAGTNSYFAGITNAFGGIASSTAVVISSTNIVTVNNFSFENGTTPGPDNGTLPVAWTQGGGINWCAVNSGTYSSIPDGIYFYALNEGPNDPNGGIYQDVGPLLPNTTYTLTVALGRSPNFGPTSGLGSPGIISLINGTNYEGLVLATTNGIPTTAGDWQDYSVTFITGPSVSGDLVVDLSVAGASTYQANFDNVRLTKAPAPPVIPITLLTDLHPLASEVTTGAPLTLSVTANGNPISYQWYNQSGPISGATGTNYTFNAVAGTNWYYVSVTNSISALFSSTGEVVSAANVVTLNNFSFENGAVSGPGGGTLPVSWSQAGGVNWCAVSSGTYSSIPDGTYFFALNEGPNDPTGGIYQDVGALLPNTTYTLTVALGRNPNFGPTSGLGSPGIISLLNGANNTGTVLASTNGIPATPGVWQDYSVTFTTGTAVSGDLTVALTVAGASTYQANFDDVRLTATRNFKIGTIKVVGGNLILTASGGLAGAAYNLLTTTNLANPNGWTTNTTGTLDVTGSFSNSIPIGTAPAQFFRAVHIP